jgi:arylsulfatase A-like enzyme
MSGRLNIILILSDDHGAWAMGCSGNEEIRTPNLDRLAQSGMRFDNFFCVSPVCSPARASLLTGAIPSRHGVQDWISQGNSGEDGIEYLQGIPGYTDYLKSAGYVCGLSGKWHLGDSLRQQKGFTFWYAHQKQGGSYYGADMVRDGKPIIESGYITDRITDEAIGFMKRQCMTEKPFYLSVHYTAPHSPWLNNNHPQEIVDSYEDCPFKSCPQDSRHPDYQGLTEEVGKNAKENLQGYFAAVTAMDANIGRILDSVDALGLAQETLICYMSDNGFSCGQHGFWGKGNGTFPFNMYDESVKVPAIFCHPGVIPPGTVCSALVSQYDFMPTLLEYAGVNHPSGDSLPGKSYLPLLKGRDMPERESVVVYDEYGPVRMIRSREWKYVHRYPYGPHELYDLVRDPGETVNLFGSQEHNETVEALRFELEKWFLNYTDPAKDGSRQPVFGNGQRNLVGPAGGGKQSFGDFKRTIEYKRGLTANKLGDSK